MLAISFSMLLFMTLISSLNFKSMANLVIIKNFATFMLILGNLVVGFGLCFAFVDYPTLIKTLTDLSTDYKMYVCIALEYIGLVSMRKNYVVNGNNITAINFCMFMSLTLVPIISYFFSDLLGFSDTIKINYQSQTEFWLFTGSLTALIFVYFADKLKGHINNWFYLLFTPVILSNTMFLSAKLMQANNPYVVSTIICIINAFILLCTFLARKEHKELKKSHAKPLTKIFVGGMFVYPLNAVIVQLIAVEFITLLKRIAQIITGAITDKIYGNKDTINKKDVVVIIIMLSIGFTMYYLRG